MLLYIKNDAFGISLCTIMDIGRVMNLSYIYIYIYIYIYHQRETKNYKDEQTLGEANRLAERYRHSLDWKRYI